MRLPLAERLDTNACLVVVLGKEAGCQSKG